MTTGRSHWKASLMAGTMLLSVGTAHAQATPSAQDLDNKLQSLKDRLGALEKVPLESVYLGSAPGLASNAPGASGAVYGTAGIGASYQHRTRFTNKGDGGLGVVFGLNDATSPVGAEVGMNILDLSRFANRGSFSFKAFDRIGKNTAVAIGLENVLNWGGTDSDPTVYGVVSHTWQRSNNPRSNALFSRLYLSGGVGNGRFRTSRDVFNAGIGLPAKKLGVFGSIGTPICRHTNGFAEWTGQDLDIGVSTAPFRRLPVSVTIALADVLQKANAFAPAGAVNDSGPRLTIGIGYSFNFTPK